MSDNQKFFEEAQEKKDLHSRKGIVLMTTELLHNADKGVLKAIFSNIFPFASEVDNNFGFNSSVKYYCISSFFDVIQEGEAMPEYILTLKTLDNRDTILESVEKTQ